jgi:hypothetical protein
MSDRHVTASALEAYVIGAMSDVEAAALEAHVAECRSCEARLQHEARLDLAFTAVAQQELARPRKTVHIGAPLAVAGSALAMAAAMILWVLPHHEVEEQPAPIATEINADASAATAQLDVQADGAPRVGVRD